MTEALWTSNEIAQALGVEISVNFEAHGVSIDSRTLTPGDLFIALQGPNQNGHAYLKAAQEAGAIAAIVSEEVVGLPESFPLIQVSDTQAALETLAITARERSQGQIIAVTGSVGKTGTKEALRTVIGRYSSVHASERSYNNHWGVPLSLARLPKTCPFGIFELGMNHAGELTPLSNMVRPHLVVITNIHLAHSAHFASIEEIATAKSEIFQGIVPGGLVLLPRDDPQYARLAKAAKGAGVAHILGFGKHKDAEIRLINQRLHADHSCLSADIQGQAVALKVSLPGSHWVMNALSVLGIVRALNGPLGLAGLALGELAALEGRGVTYQINLDRGAITLIDESYNANPASMRAAIENLGRMTPENKGRLVAVLGDMLELGESAAERHAALAENLTAAGIERVHMVGTLMTHLAESLKDKMRGHSSENARELLPLLVDSIRDGDVLMVKGSRASGLDFLVTELLNMGAEFGHHAGSSQA